MMPLSDYQADMQLLLDQAKQELGGNVRPLQISWELQQDFEARMVCEARGGLGDTPPLIWVDDDKPGHQLLVGVERYRLPTPHGDVKLVRVSAPCGFGVPDFWAVLADDLPVVYRFLLKMTREANSQEEPILRPAERDQLWNNTIGFLRQDHSLLREYGVPLKRGVLLLGEPGNGKTMACRWLRSQCARARLSWQSVTVDDYDEARRNSQLHDLFQPTQPGVVLFDDFHAALQRRDCSSGDRDQSTFLSELDGMHSKDGVVYLFTSNMDLKQLDPALRRPGRIDFIQFFHKPDESLRRRCILERWHKDIVAGIDLGRVVAETHGCSFAELDEVKKLFVLRYLETGQWDWPWVYGNMDRRQEASAPRRPIGFAANGGFGDLPLETIRPVTVCGQSRPPGASDTPRNSSRREDADGSDDENTARTEADHSSRDRAR